jgi:hypothetical protein
MTPADDLMPEQLLGKRIAFKDDEEHAGCWHRRVGLKTGTVLKLGHTLAEKVEMVDPGSAIPEELLSEETAVVRLWVRADPCPAFPRGCELAVEKECLLVMTGAG